jgi:diguanylate cyclase (GGDEF)-like protein
LLSDRLREALARSQRDRSSVALLFCDLDHFKEVNDALGHSRGDEVPVDIARRLERELRPSDTIARFGGDEFVVVCESIAGPDEAASIANRLVAELEGVAPAASADGGGPPVGVSIGVAICSDSRAEPETLLREADAAMYRAKSRGRGRIEFAGSVHGPSRSA